MLLSAECPQRSAHPIEYLRASGTDYAMWRVRLDRGEDLVLAVAPATQRRGPCRAGDGAARSAVGDSLRSALRTPKVRHVGQPHEVFPHRWAVLEWLDGPEWNASELIDVSAVRRLAGEALEVSTEPVLTRFVHGDLIPGNLLIDRGRITAIIDWGSAGYADPAQDLAPAWSLFDGRSRDAFREAVGADEAAWVQARTFELEHAVGGVLYYVPRRHPARRSPRRGGTPGGRERSPPARRRTSRGRRPRRTARPRTSSA